MNSPPLMLRSWFSRTRCLSLEQRGLLVDVLNFIWINRLDGVTAEELRGPLRIDPRTLRRLWTAEFEAALLQLRKERRPLNDSERSEVWDKTDGHCSYCGCELDTAPNRPTSFQVDHVHPVSRGGSSAPTNLAPSCRKCNQQKGDRHV